MPAGYKPNGSRSQTGPQTPYKPITSPYKPITNQYKPIQLWSARQSVRRHISSMETTNHTV